MVENPARAASLLLPQTLKPVLEAQPTLKGRGRYLPRGWPPLLCPSPQRTRPSSLAHPEPRPLPWRRGGGATGRHTLHASHTPRDRAGAALRPARPGALARPGSLQRGAQLSLGTPRESPPQRPLSASPGHGGPGVWHLALNVGSCTEEGGNCPARGVLREGRGRTRPCPAGPATGASGGGLPSRFPQPPPPAPRPVGLGLVDAPRSSEVSWCREGAGRVAHCLKEGLGCRRGAIPVGPWMRLSAAMCLRQRGYFLLCVCVCAC